MADNPSPAGDKDGDKDDDDKADASATNGGAKDVEEQATKAEAGEAPAPEEESEKALEKKIGTTVEGEREIAAPVPKPEGVTTDEPNVDNPAATYEPPAEPLEATA